MCIAVPMKIIKLDYPLAIAEAKGVKREIGVNLIPEKELKEGDYVLVHVGYAIQKISEEDFKEIWKAYEELEAILEEQTPTVDVDTLMEEYKKTFSKKNF